MEVKGKIKIVYETQTFESGFQKREFVVTTQEQYPQDIKLELYKDKCSLLEDYPVGSDVVVKFNLRGSEYQDKYYVNLNAWSISGTQSAQSNEDHATIEDGSDDLPF